MRVVRSAANHPLCGQKMGAKKVLSAAERCCAAIRVLGATPCGLCTNSSRHPDHGSSPHAGQAGGWSPASQPDMGNACCRPPAGDGGAEAVSKAPGAVGSRQVLGGGRTAAVSLGGAAGGGQGLHRPSLGWYSATDGFDGSHEAEEEWHDALSEIDLAEALEGWEEEANWHDPGVDSAIQVWGQCDWHATLRRRRWEHIAGRCHGGC